MIERLKQNNQIKLNKTMAEVMDMHTEYATKGKANAALTTGRH